MIPSLESKRIAVVDADPLLRRTTGDIIARAGYRVSAVGSPEELERILDERHHDAVLAALDGPGSRNIKRIVEIARGMPVLVLSDTTRLGEAILLLRSGVEDYLLRPPDLAELRGRLERILERPELDSRLAFFQEEMSRRSGLASAEARSKPMRLVLEQVARLAPLRSTVLVLGESGVGKELIARSIHFSSTRRDHPFVALNCAAIPASLIESELFGHEKGAFTGAHVRTRGKFEIAHRGTLFLDEIAELELRTQAKLLRVLEAKEFMRVGGDETLKVDVRVIAATNANLEEMVAARAFRRDLYYRLKVVTLVVPALRDRQDDIPALVHLFLDQLARANALPSRAISDEALAALVSYRWPGNVRELKNVLEGVLVSAPGERIDLDDLPPNVRHERAPAADAVLEPGTTLAEMERELLRITLEHTGGNRTWSAELLGIGVRTLQRKIADYELTIPPRRRRKKTRGVKTG